MIKTSRLHHWVNIFDFTAKFENVFVCWDSGADLGGRRGSTGGTYPPPPLFFPTKKIAHEKKIQKYNIDKIYQIELRLKGMTCLMIIAETKKAFSAFQFFH